MNKIFYSTEFTNEIKKYNKNTQTQIIKKLEQLRTNSNLGKPLRNVLKNYRSIRIRKYRVLYSIKNKEIIIAKLDHRKKVYK